MTEFFYPRVPTGPITSAVLIDRALSQHSPVSTSVPMCFLSLIFPIFCASMSPRADEATIFSSASAGESAIGPLKEILDELLRSDLTVALGDIVSFSSDLL